MRFSAVTDGFGKIILAAWLLPLALGFASTARATYDANGVALGGGEAPVKKQYPGAHCKPLEWKTDAAERRCDDARIAFAGIEARITFYLKKNEIQAFDLRFDAKDLERVVAHLKSSYGKPDSETRETIRRQGKADREVYKLLWERGRDRAVLTRLSTRKQATLSASRGNFEEEIYRVK